MLMAYICFRNAIMASRITKADPVEDLLSATIGLQVSGVFLSELVLSGSTIRNGCCILVFAVLE